MWKKPYEARVFGNGQDGFSDIRNSNVLFYWPHGFGDWVFLSYILPLLEPTNRYFITRFGDHNTAMMDGCAHVTPLYIGENQTDSGARAGCEHLGLRLPTQRSDGTKTLQLPLALYNACREFRIDAVFDHWFPETHGRALVPYHTKGRNLLPMLAREDRLARGNLHLPLSSGLNFAVPPWIRGWVESRLRSIAGWDGERLCLIGRQGYTSVGKNWGHRWREDIPENERAEGAECREFIREMLRRDPRWVFVTIEERHFSGNDTVRDHSLRCVSYAELFGTGDEGAIPFGLVMKALVGFADLAVGVPAGPYHLCMAKPGLPTVGLWLEHMPSWYDEPKAESVHLISQNVWASEGAHRPGSFEQCGELKFRSKRLETRIIPGSVVVEAVDELLGGLAR